VKKQMLQVMWHQDDCAGAKSSTGLWMPPGIPFKERGEPTACLVSFGVLAILQMLPAKSVKCSLLLGWTLRGS